jgi:hypothetical protein
MIFPICLEMPLLKPLNLKEYRMKSGNRSFFALAFAALFMTTIFSSCGDSGNPAGPASSSLVGTWNLATATTGGYTVTAGTTTLTAVQTLNSNNTYTSTMTLYLVTPPEVTTESGTWATSGNKLITTPTGSAPDTVTYSISGNTMTIVSVDKSSGTSVSSTMVFNKQ